MKIVLARHGQPTMPDSSRIAGHDVGNWARRYNEAGITKTVAPPERVRTLARTVGRVIASDLPRSVESAAWLVSGHDIQIEPELREAGLPESIGVPLRLHPRAWIAIARVAWWLNWCRASETVAATRARANRVVDRLSSLAREHGTVLVVGHGMFNRFVATRLLECGWRGPRILPAGYWATATFTRNGDRAMTS